MCERKVLNKYYPPDFDPEKLVAHKFMLRNKNGMDKRLKERKRQMQVRMMFPFTMCCEHCGEFNYIGKKFNSRVQKLKGEDYLGIAIWRFYGKCPNCSGEFSFKTDPKNTDYVLESGGTRTYEPLKDAEQAEKALKDELENISEDAIKSLEHKTYNTANELAALEQLDDLKRMNKRLFEREKITAQTLEYIEQKNKSTEPELHADDLKELEAFRQSVARKQLSDDYVEDEEIEVTSSCSEHNILNSEIEEELKEDKSASNVLKRGRIETHKDTISATSTRNTGDFGSNFAPTFQIKKRKPDR